MYIIIYLLLWCLVMYSFAGLVQLSGSILENEKEVKCGICAQKKKLVTDRSAIKAIQYFKDSKYCTIAFKTFLKFITMLSLSFILEPFIS